MMLKTGDVEKYFIQQDVMHVKPRIYPPIEIGNNPDDSIMPEK